MAMQDEDLTHHDYSCEFVKYVPQLDRVVLFERTSRRFKLFDSTLRCRGVLRGHTGSLLTAEYIPEHRWLVTSSQEGQIFFWFALSHSHL